MAAEGVIITFIFTGVDGEVIPQNATHLIIHESVTVIPNGRFGGHPNIVEVYCHVGVIRIERFAFNRCPRLKRLIIPGVKVVGTNAFYDCQAIRYIECDKLEIVREYGFNYCGLSSINLPSAQIVESGAFSRCFDMTDVKFGKELQTLGSVRGAFFNCHSLERITLPLKNGLFENHATYNVFKGCENLKHVDLVEGALLSEIIAAMQLEEWRNDMNEELDSINQVLPNAPAGGFYCLGGEKTLVIRDWMARVLRKIIHYKAQHRRLLREATIAMHVVLPSDIVESNVLPFLALPSHRFDGEENEDEEGEEFDFGIHYASVYDDDDRRL